MIRKWKVTPVSSTSKPKVVIHPPPPPRPDSRSKDDETVPIRTTTVLTVKPKKPRRHTAGDSKQTTEDIRAAKTLVESMNAPTNPPPSVGQQPADPTNTLERKQLICMLKERYGNEIDGFKMSGDNKERIRKERQRERDQRHTHQRMVVTTDNREMHHHGGVHHSPAMNGSRDHFSGTGSEESDDSLSIGTQQRMYVAHAHGKSAKHKILRRSDSEDDGIGSNVGSNERLQMATTCSFNNNENIIRSQGVLFLQCADDVKRVNLPAPITSIDTLQALFVNSFPDRIGMQEFEEGMKVVYIKDVDTGTYYMLEDIRDVLNRSFLKIHEKSPSVHSASQSTTSSVETLGISKTSTIPNSFPNKTSFDENSHPDSTNESTLSSGSTKATFRATTNYEHNNHVRDTTDYQKSQSPAKRSPMYTNGSTDNNCRESYVITQQTNTNDIRVPIVKSLSKPERTESVEDQLDDLTELLKSALGDTEQHNEEEVLECVNTKNPGKLDPSLIENIQRETQTLARKSTLPKHFQPTIMVAAQQESDRRTSERSKSDSEPPKVSPKTTKMSVVTTKVGRSFTIAEKDSNEHNNHNNNYNNNKKLIDKNKKESDGEKRFATIDENISSPQKRQFHYSNTTHTNDVCRDNSTKEPQTMTQHGPLTNQSECRRLDSHSDCMSTVVESCNESDVLMDQIMDMELEVKARTNHSIRQKERSSSECSSTKSTGLPCDTVNFNYEDQPKQERVNFIQQQQQQQQQQPVENHCSGMNGTHVNGTTNGTAAHKNGVTTVKYTSTSKFKYDKEDIDTHHSNGITDDVIDGSNVVDGTTSMQHIYASISKVTDLPTSPKTNTTFSNTTNGQKPPLKRVSTGEKACHQGSVSTPDFCELEDSAKCVHTSLQQLRRELACLRKAHTDGVRSFKADIQKKLLEFRKKASRVDEALHQKLEVNNNIIFADQHPVRERRHRLSGDQLNYNDKMSNTEVRLKHLEGDMEKVRCSVVDKKRVENPHKLKQLHEELTMLTKGLAEIKNRFHGLHDMLKVVIVDEQKIITNEERFLKEEPKKLEGLIARCKVLSGTLFTLERLASVQLENGDSKKPPQNQQQQQQQQQQSETKTITNTKTHKQTAASYNYNQSAPFNDVFDIEDLKSKRNVRFNHKN